MAQKVPLRSPFAGIDFSGENQQHNGEVINFANTNDIPSFPIEAPSQPLTLNQTFIPQPKNFSLPNTFQELSGSISLTGGYSILNPKPINSHLSDLLDEPPLLEGIRTIFKKN